MPAITRVEVIATGPPMPDVQFTDALPAVFTTVTYVVVTDDTGAVGVGAVESDTFGGLRPGAAGGLASDCAGPDRARPARAAAVAALVVASGVVGVAQGAVRRRSRSRAGTCPARHAGLPLHQLLGGARDEVAGVRVTAVRARPRGAARPSSDRSSPPATRPRNCTSRVIPAATSARWREVRAAFPGLGLIVDAESVYDRAGDSGRARPGRASDVALVRGAAARPRHRRLPRS